MTSAAWESVGSSSEAFKAVNINDAFPYSGACEIKWSEKKTSARMAPVIGHAPEIQIMKPDGGYEMYYYVANAKLADGVTLVEGWCNSSGAYADEVNGGDEMGNVTPGVGLWFRDPEHETPYTTFAGQVMIRDEASIDCTSDWCMRAPAWPKDLHLNNADEISFAGLTATYSIKWSEKKTSARMAPVIGYAPEIQIMKDDGGYEMYYYVTNAKMADGVTLVEGWCNSSGAYADEVNGGDEVGTVHVGQAFWVRTLGAGILTMTLKK